MGGEVDERVALAAALLRHDQSETALFQAALQVLVEPWDARRHARPTALVACQDVRDLARSGGDLSRGRRHLNGFLHRLADDLETALSDELSDVGSDADQIHGGSALTARLTGPGLGRQLGGHHFR